MSNWGPSYGDPTHPTTGELPRVGDGRRTDELKTVRVDAVSAAHEQAREPSRPRYEWERPDHGPRYGEPSAPRQPPASGWSVPRSGRDSGDSSERANRFRYSWESSPPRFESSRPRFETSRPRTEPSRPRTDDTTQFARAGDGLRGSVGPVTVQVDHVQIDGGHTASDTQLLPTSAFMRPKEDVEIPEAFESPRPEPGTGSMPAMRHQIGPDWTQTPLRLLAAAVVATGVLGASAASLISIGNWINP